MHTRRKWTALFAVGAAVASAVLGGSRAYGGLGHEAAAPVSARLINNCTQEQVARLVASFIAAYNAGNAAVVDRLFAREPAFQWFSMPGPNERLGKKAENRSTIETYVLNRHRHHEQITLIHEQGNLQLLVRRWADDYHARNAIEGKGEAICPAGKKPKLIVWSL